jgi:hypothetical protein
LCSLSIDCDAMILDTVKARRHVHAKLEAAREKMAAAAQEVEAAQHEYDCTIAIIEAIEKLRGNGSTKESNASASGVKVRPIRGGNVTEYGETRPRIRLWQGIRHGIRVALQEKPEGITVRDAEEFIVRTYPAHKITRKQLSLSLSRMHRKTGELRVLRVMIGNQPALYGLANKNGNVSEKTGEPGG